MYLLRAVGIWGLCACWLSLVKAGWALLGERGLAMMYHTWIRILSRFYSKILPSPNCDFTCRRVESTRKVFSIRRVKFPCRSYSQWKGRRLGMVHTAVRCNIWLSHNSEVEDSFRSDWYILRWLLLKHDQLHLFLTSTKCKWEYSGMKARKGGNSTFLIFIISEGILSTILAQ